MSGQALRFRGGGTPSKGLVSKEVSRLVRSLPEAVSFAKQTDKTSPAFVTRFARTTAPSPNLGEGRGEVKKSAFTLAEVLITLGVIGVVAALTLPSLIQNHQKHVTVNKLKSTYAILNNAIELAKNDYGLDVNQWDLPDETDSKVLSDYFAEKYLMPYLKVIYDCKDATRRCVPIVNGRGFIIANGAVIAVYVGRGTELRVHIYMYINGYKKPEAINPARDAFLIEFGGGSGEVGLDKNKFWPYGYRTNANRSYYTNSDNTSCNRDKTVTRQRCFALIMYDGWKIADDYPW